jgi:hypothetical protein
MIYHIGSSSTIMEAMDGSREILSIRLTLPRRGLKIGDWGETHKFIPGF